MTPATITPPPVKTSGRVATGPTPYRWTIKAYRELDKTGLFHNVKTTLIRGEIYVMVAPKPPHDTALNLMQEYLRTTFPSGHHIRNQQGFDIGLDNDPEPDLAVVAGSIRDYANRTPTAAAMIVEIAETSLFFDTTTKAELYATAGVREYWVVDVENRQLQVFREPVSLPAGLGATAYRTHLTLSATDTVAPLAVPTATVCVADLLP